MKILMTFTGYHDPYCQGLDGSKQEGPILTALRNVNFGAVHLFFNNKPGIPEITDLTKKTIEKTIKEIRVYTHCLNLPDPTDYAMILENLSKIIQQIKEENGTASFYIAPASGTPQMHASWIMLLINHNLDAKILQTREPKFITDKRSSVREIEIISEVYEKIVINEKIVKAAQENDPFESRRLAIGIIGQDSHLMRALDVVRTYADSGLNVLITGESGTGKKLFAQLIHDQSQRNNQPFIAVNCAGFGEQTAISALFGHKRGSFTGAYENRKGVFQQADGGTLFLDEFVELEPRVQAMLLRAIDEGVIEPMGLKSEKVDVRVIAATNENIEKALASKKLRHDLYARMKTITIELPPLRNRVGDILYLCNHFISKVKEKKHIDIKYSIIILPSALKKIEGYTWPYNIRELEDVIEMAVIKCVKDNRHNIGSDDLALTEKQRESEIEGLEPFPGCVEIYREKMMKKAYEKTGGNWTRAAKIVGMEMASFRSFYKRNYIDNK